MWRQRGKEAQVLDFKKKGLYTYYMNCLKGPVRTAGFILQKPGRGAGAVGGPAAQRQSGGHKPQASAGRDVCTVKCALMWK